TGGPKASLSTRAAFLPPRAAVVAPGADGADDREKGAVKTAGNLREEEGVHNEAHVGGTDLQGSNVEEANVEGADNSMREAGEDGEELDREPQKEEAAPAPASDLFLKDTTGSPTLSPVRDDGTEEGATKSAEQ
ncbi:unnamed protein product, partial [Discosporangium mesarthrocarpum]